MNFLGTILGILIIFVVIAFLSEGDNLLCNYAEQSIQTYELCRQLDECDVNSNDIADKLWAEDFIARGKCNMEEE